VNELIEAAPAETQADAAAKLVALKQEAAKGNDANDGMIVKLVDGLVALMVGLIPTERNGQPIPADASDAIERSFADVAGCWPPSSGHDGLSARRGPLCHIDLLQRG
jgi:hypothetical protein